jgi:hypothetical protein
VTATMIDNKSTMLKVMSIKELNRLAKTGQYTYFSISGSEDEYVVSNGKLVKL